MLRPSNSSKTIDARFDRLMLQSGTSLPAGVVLRLCLLGAVVVGGAAFLVTENLLMTAVGVEVGASFPVIALMGKARRRRRQMIRQLPAMAAELLAAARLGRGLEQTLFCAGTDLSGPLGSELLRGAGRIRLGLGVEEALENLAERTGVEQLEVLPRLLGLHERHGTSLINVLQRIERALISGRSAVRAGVD